MIRDELGQAIACDASPSGEELQNPQPEEAELYDGTPASLESDPMQSAQPGWNADPIQNAQPLWSDDPTQSG